jgi:hypothetical protein
VTVTLAVTADRLLFQADGQLAVPLRAVTAQHFVADVVDTDIIVVPSSAAGDGPTLTLRQRGDEVTATMIR